MQTLADGKALLREVVQLRSQEDSSRVKIILHNYSAFKVLIKNEKHFS